MIKKTLEIRDKEKNLFIKKRTTFNFKNNRYKSIRKYKTD